MAPGSALFLPNGLPLVCSSQHANDDLYLIAGEGGGDRRNWRATGACSQGSPTSDGLAGNFLLARRHFRVTSGGARLA